MEDQLEPLPIQNSEQPEQTTSQNNDAVPTTFDNQIQVIQQTMKKSIDSSKKKEKNKFQNIPEETFAIHKVLILYMIQTAIYTVMSKLKLINPSYEIYWPVIFLLGGSILLFIFIRGYDGKYDGSNCCACLVFIMFFVFKIYFFIFIYYLVQKFDVNNLYCSKGDSTEEGASDNPTDFGNFDFANLTLFVFYLVVIILICCMRKINILLYFLIGIGMTLIMFFSLFAINKIFAAYCAALIFAELAYFLIILKLSITKNKLAENSFLNNVLVIDYLKYVVLMMLSLLIVALFFYLIACFCKILACFLECCVSRPTSVDSKGNVYDQYNNVIAHYSKTPKYVDSDGNVYDRHHNKIQPDICQIF